MVKHLFFDLDGTITESRQDISKKMKEKLLSLKQPIVVISGAESSRIKKQMMWGWKEERIAPLTCMGQSGNHTPDWHNKLTTEEVQEIYKHLQEICKQGKVKLNSRTVQNRGCQISLSFTEHSAPLEIKYDFDPDKNKRKQILKDIPFKSKTLEVRIAGTTCLDYLRKGNLKGDNLKRYMKLHGLKKKDCVYYGDALFKGGNDESVIGVMKTVAVKNPNHLLKLL